MMNVYEAANKRLELIFREFDNVYVSFSGGKDSGVLLNLCMDYLRKNLPGRKLGVLHLDYEAQYQLTTDYVDHTFQANADILEVYRCCIPFKVMTCTSMHQPYWRPWEPAMKHILVRELPPNAMTEKEFPFYTPEMWDYDFQERFGQWLHRKKQAKRTVCLVGIRTQESLNRWRAIHSVRNYKNFRGINWTKELHEEVYNAYPIHDWLTTDVWIANGKFNWPYNRLYDLFFKAGMNIEQMRVASPFLSEAKKSLKLYRVIEPYTWAKLVGRVNGVNFSVSYGGTTALRWGSVRKPPGFTWERYMHFLLDTLPEEIRLNYLEKLATSIKFWREKGGVLSTATIEKLKAAGVKFEIGPTSNYRTSKLPVRMEYIDEINITEAKEIPSFKRMCICIMKNDHLCKYMGFALTRKEMSRRENVMKIIKHSYE